MIEKTGHFVGRIDQIDAKELDDEIDQHVSSQIKEVGKTYNLVLSNQQLLFKL